MTSVCTSLLLLVEFRYVDKYPLIRNNNNSNNTAVSNNSNSNNTITNHTQRQEVGEEDDEEGRVIEESCTCIHTNTVYKHVFHYYAYVQAVTGFSLFPLLSRDGLRIPYMILTIGMLCIYGIIIPEIKCGTMRLHSEEVSSVNNINPPSHSTPSLFHSKDSILLEQQERKLNIAKHKQQRAHDYEQITIVFIYLYLGSCICGMIMLHICECIIIPPARYPDLYAVLFALFTAAQLIVLYVYTIYWQLFLIPVSDTVSNIKNKSN